MKFIPKLKFLPAILTALFLAIFYPCVLASDTEEDNDSGEFVIKKDNGSLNPPGPINRVPAIHGSAISATYSDPYLIFNNISCHSGSASISVTTPNGTPITSGVYSIDAMYQGIWIGNADSFVVTVAFSNGSRYIGYYYGY